MRYVCSRRTWLETMLWAELTCFLSQNCGVSYEFGRAMGNDEPVTPVFPNSDYWYVLISLSCRS